MNIEKTVFGKLAQKIELESQRFDFALADDIENNKKQMIKLSESASNQMLKAESEVFDYGKLAGDVKGYATLVLQDIEQLKSKAKDLGIDLPNNILESEKIAKSYFNKGAAIEKFAQSFNIESAGKF